MQFLQFCGTGQVFGVQSSLAASMELTRFDEITWCKLFRSCHYALFFLG